MYSKILKSALLSLTIIIVSLWASNPQLSTYNLQLTGALTILYFAFKVIFRHTTKSTLFPDTLILISISLLLVFSSGGLDSPIFFILDLLIFTIALLLAPYQAAVASFLLVSIFLFQHYQNLSSSGIIDLISLVLITPLAIILSNSYLKYLESEGKISVLREAIKDEQVDSLLWISTTAKPSLSSILNSLTDIVMYFNSKGDSLNVQPALIDKLKTIQKDLISLYSSTDTLGKSIEESSDKMEL
jgi:hypothetical protein